MSTTAVTTTPPQKAALVAGGSVAAIIPQSIEEMFRLAGALHASGLAPQSLGTADKVMVAIMAGAELGLAPFQSLQSFAVINGKPAIWGDGLMAVVRSHGFRVKEWVEGEGDDLTARCELTRPDTGETVPGEFSVADAKKAGLWGKAGPWQSYPKRMLKMRARAFALRDGAADVLRGFQIREEVEDYQVVRDVTPKAAGIMARLEAHGRADDPGFSHAHVEAETRPLAPEEIDAILDEDTVPVHATDAAVEDFPGDKASTPGANAANNPAGGLTLAQRVEQFDGRLAEAKTTNKLKAIWGASQGLRDDLDHADPEELPALTERFNARFAEIEAAERGGA